MRPLSFFAVIFFVFWNGYAVANDNFVASDFDTKVNDTHCSESQDDEKSKIENDFFIKSVGHLFPSNVSKESSSNSANGSFHRNLFVSVFTFQNFCIKRNKKLKIPYNKTNLHIIHEALLI